MFQHQRPKRIPFLLLQLENIKLTIKFLIVCLFNNNLELFELLHVFLLVPNCLTFGE